MKRIYETERYANKTNVDYGLLDNLAKSLYQDECDSDVPIISYARVSTPQQLKGTSLQNQHESNVRDIRAMFDNPIVYVTEVGSGANDYRNRIISQAISDASENTAMFFLAPDRLARSIKKVIPMLEAMKQKKIWQFFHNPKTHELSVYRDYSNLNILKDAPEDSQDALLWFTKLCANPAVPPQLN